MNKIEIKNLSGILEELLDFFKNNLSGFVINESLFLKDLKYSISNYSDYYIDIQIYNNILEKTKAEINKIILEYSKILRITTTDKQFENEKHRKYHFIKEEITKTVDLFEKLIR